MKLFRFIKNVCVELYNTIKDVLIDEFKGFMMIPIFVSLCHIIGILATWIGIDTVFPIKESVAASWIYPVGVGLWVIITAAAAVAVLFFSYITFTILRNIWRKS
jgi:hypothetical protein